MLKTLLIHLNWLPSKEILDISYFHNVAAVEKIISMRWMNRCKGRPYQTSILLVSSKGEFWSVFQTSLLCKEQRNKRRTRCIFNLWKVPTKILISLFHLTSPRTNKATTT
jgi:hypothetical protein